MSMSLFARVFCEQPGLRVLYNIKSRGKTRHKKTCYSAACRLINDGKRKLDYLNSLRNTKFTKDRSLAAVVARGDEGYLTHDSDSIVVS